MIYPLHERTKEIVKNLFAREAELIDALQENDRERLFEKMGFSSLFKYALSHGLSESYAYQMITVARKCVEVPELKVAIESNVLNSSKAKRIVSALTPENSEFLIEKAATRPQREVEQEVAKINPNARVKERIKSVSQTLSELKLGILPSSRRS